MTQWVPIEGVPYKESGNYIVELEEKIAEFEKEIKRLNNNTMYLPHCQYVRTSLLEWFKDLTLDEKVEIYMWWKYESVNLVIVNNKWSGEITIRVNRKEE